jgi:molybdopterin-guanine dinucleotide biosynthesis protein B
MQHALVPILGFAAYSGVGKTTLLSQIIPLLKQHGLRVGLIKHGHHNFDVDVPGKDSYRLRQAGASPVLIVSKYRRAIITEINSEQEPRLDDQLKLFDQSELDLVLVEGFKSEKFPKIELHRVGLAHPLLYLNDADIIAVASDGGLDISAPLVALDINQPEQVAGFIWAHFSGLKPC